MLKKVIPFVLIFAFVLILYYPALFTYFSQDDFFHFKVSITNGSIKEFLNLFGFYSFKQRGIAFYRPISRELPFNIFYMIFGLNALPFRIFSFIIHFVNIVLVYLLTQKLFKNKNLSVFASLFFGISAANVATLYYLAGGIQALLATSFTLLTLISFKLYLETNKLKFKLISFFTFLLAVASEEQAFIIPVLLIYLIYVFKKNLSAALPYLAIVSILIYLEIFKIGFSPGEKEYQLIFNIKTFIHSLSWYTVWALGVPETLIDFVLPGFKLNPTLLRYWSNYYIFIFPAFFISSLSIIITTLYLFFKKRQIFLDKIFLFALIWFPLGLLPVLLLPLHKSTHYLYISLAPFWIVIGYITLKLKKAFKTVLIISLIVLSSASAILGSSNYWAANRGKLAEKLINQVKTNYPNLPKGAIIYIQNDPNYPHLTEEWGNSSKQASFILNGYDALQLLYKDTSLKVYYEDINQPQAIDKNTYPLILKIY